MLVLLIVLFNKKNNSPKPNEPIITTTTTTNRERENAKKKIGDMYYEYFNIEDRDVITLEGENLKGLGYEVEKSYNQKMKV